MITDADREEFAEQQRRQFEAAGPFTEGQRAALTALFLSVLQRRAREAGQAAARAARAERASVIAPAVAPARENARETLNPDVSVHVKGDTR
jgi:hypothetical protein